MVTAEYFESPREFERDPQRWSLFLAGGITGCPDWQNEVCGRLSDSPLAVLNPRRRDFPIHDPSAAPAQIKWEFQHLRRAEAVLFWFPCETLCPIALYELGAWSMTPKPLFVGCHPAYQRRYDVLIQTKLARPNVRVVDSLDDLILSVRNWCPPGHSG